MDIQTTKLELMQLILQTEKESLLQKVRAIFDKETRDWYESMSEEEKASLQEGIEDLEAGLVVSREEAMKAFDR